MLQGIKSPSRWVLLLELEMTLRKSVIKIVSVTVFRILAFAFAELVDNALAATADNEGPRKIEIRLVRH